MNKIAHTLKTRALGTTIPAISLAAILLYALAIPTVMSGTSIFSNIGTTEVIEIVGLLFLVSIASWSFKSKISGSRKSPKTLLSAAVLAFDPSKTQSEQDSSEDFDLDSEQRFSLVLRTFDIATFYCDLEHRYTWSHNFLGSPDDLIGKTDADILPPDVAQVLLDLKGKALKDGGMHDGELSFDIGTETRTFSVQVAPRRDRLGNIIGTMAVSCDVTERAIWQKHLVMMMREVNHRARNLMSIIVSICGQTARSALDIREYKEKITGRVMSLAGSMDLVTKDNWVASSLKKLLTVQLSALPNSAMRRVQITGTDVFLKSNAVQSVGLAIHELATNASRHGALSHSDGRVDISITTNDCSEKPELILTWRETSPHQIQKADVQGFGLTTLNAIVASELNGLSEFSWHPRGIEYTLTMPGEVMGVDAELPDGSTQGTRDPSSSMRESLTGEVIELPQRARG